MARPISWLGRLHEIRHAVASSVRSHYERKEVETLFQIQPRAAQLLLELLPATKIGRSRLVERQALADFLDRIHDADDPSAELEQIRASGSVVLRKKIRTLVRRDVDPVQIDSLPSNIKLTPGQMIVTFKTIEDLAQAMYSLARALETDGDEVARRYEVREVADDDGPQRGEFQEMLLDLSALEALHAPKNIPENLK